jgi:hypothetical protein
MKNRIILKKKMFLIRMKMFPETLRLNLVLNLVNYREIYFSEVPIPQLDKALEGTYYPNQ